jgi:hypothetical protein
VVANHPKKMTQDSSFHQVRFSQPSPEYKFESLGIMRIKLLQFKHHELFLSSIEHYWL